MQHLTDYYILYLLLICRIFLKYGTGNVMNNTMSEGIMKKSIVKQLMIQMFFVLIIPVLLVGFFYDYSYRKALYRDAKQKLQEYVENEKAMNGVSGTPKNADLRRSLARNLINGIKDLSGVRSRLPETRF